VPTLQRHAAMLGSVPTDGDDISSIAWIDGDGTVIGGLAVTPWWGFTKSLIAASVMRLI
jgi:hypothetical protein